MLGLDYAGGVPGGASIAASGYGFVVRYLAPGGAGLPGKLLTPTEADDLRANGVDIVSNWESYASRMSEGTAAGVQDAQAAWAQHKVCGGPDNRPVYFSADWDVQPAELSAVFAYLAGATSVLGAANVGIYGGFRAVDGAMAGGHAAWGWQTDAWSYGQSCTTRNLHQRIQTVTVGGVGCDVNDSITTDFGQWSYQGDDMTDAQYNQIRADIGYIRDQIRADVAGVPAAVLTAPVARPDGTDTNLYAVTAWSDYHVNMTRTIVRDAAASVAQQVVAAGSASGDPAAVAAAVVAAVNDKLAALSVTISAAPPAPKAPAPVSAPVTPGV